MKQWPFPSSDPRVAPAPTPQPVEGESDLCECPLGLMTEEESRTNRCKQCGKEIFS